VVDSTLVVGIELEGALVVFHGELLIAGFGVSLAETVVDVGGFRIFLRVQLEDSDGVGDAILFQKLVAELIQYVFVEIVLGRLGSFPFLVLGDGGVDVSVAYGFTQVADKGVLRGSGLLAVKNGENAFGEVVQAGARRVVEDENQVVIVDDAHFIGVEAVDASAVGDDGFAGAGFVFGNSANDPAEAVLFQIGREELLPEFGGEEFVGVEGLIPFVEVFDGGVERTGAIGEGHVEVSGVDDAVEGLAVAGGAFGDDGGPVVVAGVVHAHGREDVFLKKDFIFFPVTCSRMAPRRK